MSDYIPSKEPAKVLWLWNFATWLIEDDFANAQAHGLTKEEACGFYMMVSQTTMALLSAREARGAARGTAAAKNDALGAALALARDFAQRIQLNPNTTDQDRGEAGLTIRDDKPTKSTADDVLSITPPDIHLDFSIRQQVTIHWGPNPQDERHNGKPHGVIGCEIQYHRGGIPTDNADWRQLDTDTDSPYIHTLHESTPITYAYRARYLGKKLKHGPPWRSGFYRNSTVFL